jgi:hypothetical protein
VRRSWKRSRKPERKRVTFLRSKKLDRFDNKMKKFVVFLERHLVFAFIENGKSLHLNFKIEE